MKQNFTSLFKRFEDFHPQRTLAWNCSFGHVGIVSIQFVFDGKIVICVQNSIL